MRTSGSLWLSARKANNLKGGLLRGLLRRSHNLSRTKLLRHWEAGLEWEDIEIVESEVRHKQVPD